MGRLGVADEAPVDAPEEGVSLDLLGPCLGAQPLSGVPSQQAVDHILHGRAYVRGRQCPMMKGRALVGTSRLMGPRVSRQLITSCTKQV